ncbi:MAG: helix-turn-helix domain-containing protein [Eubacterium sp.]
MKNDFIAKYQNGMTIMEIVEQGDISRRTVYRYKAYYEEQLKRVEQYFNKEWSYEEKTWK